MQQTITVHICGQHFFMDEDAHARLSSYLEKLQQRYRGVDGGDDIVADVESRLAELFAQKVNAQSGVVTLAVVQEAIAIMGEPEEFEANAFEQSTGNSQRDEPQAFGMASGKKLYRDPDNRILGGVCAGLAAYLNIDVTIVRIVMVVLTLISAFMAAVVYVLLWVVVPEAITPSQKLQMRGENVNLENIEKTLRNEFEEVKKGFANMKEKPTYQKGKQFFDRFNMRDKTVLIVVAVLLALVLMRKMVGWIVMPWVHFSSFHFSWPFAHVLSFNVFLPMVLLLVGVGVIYKPLMRPMLWILAIIIGVVVVASIVSGLLGVFYPFVI
jgi:phage shock protein PspC (stress-responsive transcriptional regulator)